jgi:uncharacterized membrane protein YgcG
VEIHPKEEGLVFKRRVADVVLTDKEPAPGELGTFDADLLSKLRAVGGTVTDEKMREKVAPAAGDLKSSLYDALVARGYYARSPETVKILWLLGGLATVGALGALFTLLSPTKSPVPAVIGGLLAVPAVVLVSRAMSARTPAGARAHMQVLGFQEFIRRAHTDQLEWRSKVEPTAAVYERLLPHAVAFGLVTQWTDAFRDILTAAPGWYHTPPGQPFNSVGLGRDLETVSNAVATAGTTPPRSSGASGGHSGFGGGGFSGGGFGGGGGGSW